MNAFNFSGLGTKDASTGASTGVTATGPNISFGISKPSSDTGVVLQPKVAVSLTYFS